MAVEDLTEGAAGQIGDALIAGDGVAGVGAGPCDTGVDEWLSTDPSASQTRWARRAESGLRPPEPASDAVVAIS